MGLTLPRGQELQCTYWRSCELDAAYRRRKKGYARFCKNIKAFELLLNLNLTYSANGIRVDVDDPNNLGPILSYDESITAIASLLDEAKTDLSGATVAFSSYRWFCGFDDAAGLTKFNRALAARVDVYRKQWATALTDLDESFFDLNGDFNEGVERSLQYRVIS